MKKNIGSWVNLGVPRAVIGYVGQSDSLIYQNKKTGSRLEVANIFGMGSFNVILVSLAGRKVLTDGLSRDKAINFAEKWMKDNQG